MQGNGSWLVEEESETEDLDWLGEHSVSSVGLVGPSVDGPGLICRRIFVRYEGSGFWVVAGVFVVLGMLFQSMHYDLTVYCALHPQYT